MRRLAAPKIFYRIVAVMCFALGAGWHFWSFQTEPDGTSRIMVQPLPQPSSLLEDRRLLLGDTRLSDSLYGGHIVTCGAYFAELDNPRLTRASRLREKACMLESEEARKFILKNWKEKTKSHIEVEFPCPDCMPVYDVMIEQNPDGQWQITIRRKPDRETPEPKESVAVSLKRRPATELEDYEKHVVGEPVLVFLDARRRELLSL